MAGGLSGVDLIAAERRRQVEGEGWSASHDDYHRNGELALAAIAYAARAARAVVYKLRVAGNPVRHGYYFDDPWPWSDGDKRVPGFEPSDWPGRIRMLVKAGALIAAEIDRLQREATRKTG